MRVAIIDLGTNSVRFDVHAIGPTGRVKLLHREKLMIRLGQGVFLKGRMDANAIDRAVVALGHFRQVADSLNVRRIVAFGTSALREAQDSSQLLSKVREETGVEIKVISGREEASLIAIGVLENEKIPKGKFALVDIGGGSTEISICRGRKALQGDSFPLGTARLQQVFLKRSPPKANSIRQLEEYIRHALGQGRKWPKVETIVGSSGTVKAVARILGKKSFTLRELSSLVEKMSSLSTTELLDIPGMEPKRVDMILAGALLLQEVMTALGAKKVIPTEFSLRDGILEEEKRLARSHKSSLIELHLDDLFQRASRFGLEEIHLRQMVALAGTLFDRLTPVHRLRPQWKIYLLATVILRSVGEIVSYAGREKHSYYMVKHSDFGSIQGWENEFIALLCLYQSGGKPNKVGALLGKERAAPFLRLLALMRVVDGLDIGPRAQIELKRVSFNRRQVKLTVSGKGTAGVEQLMIGRKKKMFEEVFGRELQVERLKKG